MEGNLVIVVIWIQVLNQLVLRYILQIFWLNKLNSGMKNKLNLHLYILDFFFWWIYIRFCMTITFLYKFLYILLLLISINIIFDYSLKKYILFWLILFSILSFIYVKCRVHNNFPTLLQPILSGRFLSVVMGGPKSNLSYRFKLEPIITYCLWFVVKIL